MAARGPGPTIRGTPAPSPAGVPAGWDPLTRAIQHCRRCPLHASRTHAVVYRGGAHPRVVFVGEAPGADEDRRGLPFVGRSGSRLDRAIALLGLGPTEFGIVNLIKCRPPENRFDPRAAATCRPYLDRQLALLEPEVVVTLGGRALAALDPGAPKVMRAAGAPRRWGSIPLFPLLHPAATFRATRNLERWDRDVRRLGTALSGWLRPHKTI